MMVILKETEQQKHEIANMEHGKHDVNLLLKTKQMIMSPMLQNLLTQHN